MMRNLTTAQKKIYKYLFIDGLPEAEVIALLGYKNGSTKTGYKFVKKIRSQIVEKARTIVKDVVA